MELETVGSYFANQPLKRTFGQGAASVELGSLPTFAAFAHETNVKPEGEWRQCGQSEISLHKRQ
jgi:hypothetical protein